MGPGTKVLVLNQDYTALTVCSVNKAFVLLYLNKAESVISAGDKYLRTVSRTYPLPSVIRLFDYKSIPYKNVVLTRHNIFKRDNNRCQYCGKTNNLTLDHVMPKSRGGKGTWDNLVTACQSCNAMKGDRTPEEAQMPLLQKPFKPSFVYFLRNFAGKADREWLTFLGSKNNR